MPALPLLPLNTVVFPGQRLPLHIFESRYRRLVRETQDSGQPFGIVLIKEGRETGGGAVPVEVGCTVRLVEVEEFPDGRYNIACEGERRFRIVETGSEQPYLVAEIEYLPPVRDAGTPQARTAAGNVHALFTRYLGLQLALQNSWQRRFRMPDGPEALVNFVGARIDAPPQVKQEVLGADSAVRQLQLLRRILRSEIRSLQDQVALHRRQHFRGLGVLN